MTRQPTWWCVHNAGDVHPLEHGGAFVLVDMTGVYTPELEIWEEPIATTPPSYQDQVWEDFVGEDGETVQVLTWATMQPEDLERWERHTILLDRCTYINGILSDNRYHPEHPAWWASTKGELESICGSMDISITELIELFISADPVERAMAYRMVYDYWGPQAEPTIFTDRAEVKARMDRYLSEIKELENKTQ